MSQKKLTRVLIMAGGTGGHIFPGVAVANHLHAQDIEVHWLGTAEGLEAKIIPQANIPLHLIKINGLRGKGLKTLLQAPSKLARAIYQAITIIKQLQPDVVIGMGGFASGPGGLAAWLLKRPLIIHEQNAKPGMTNKMLARLAQRVLTGFPSAFKAQNKVIDVGNPVREEIATLPPPAQRLANRAEPLRLLIVGGSLGAQSLNELVPRALALIPQDKRPEVMHQTGDKHYETAKAVYATEDVAVDLRPFIDDMAYAYSWADVVLCRAGALTVAELCAVGLGAILVPYPHAVDDHQTANAMYMVENKAAICIQQKELTAANLADIVTRFTDSPSERLEMAQAAYQLRKVNAAQRIFEICQEVCR